MSIKRTTRETIFDLFNVIMMCLLIFITVYPIIHVAFASLSDGNQLMAHRGILLKPEGFSLASYKVVLQNKAITNGYVNTLFVVTAGICISLFLSALGAFFMSKKGLLWQKPVTLFIIFTMFFSGGLIPFYLTVRGLGIRDTLWAMIIPYAISTYNMIIMRTSFSGIPTSLQESAEIDGANDFTILFRIIIPLSMPVIAVMILYYGVNYWNSWFPAMIFIKKRSLYPLQLVMREILIENSTASMSSSGWTDETRSVAETIKYATIMVATVPILLIYPFVQKYFVKGVLIGGVKG